MAYIGRSVDVGIFEKQVLTPDSTTTSFALTYAVGSANSLFVVYGGVVQEPGVAYSVSGGGQTIVFSEAPATGTTLYIIYYGKQLTTPRAAGQETTKQTFSGDGTTTVFTLTDPPVVPAGIMVFVDGILQREGSGNNFVSSGSTIAFTAAPDSSAEIDVYTLVKEKVSIDTVADGSITLAKLAASHPTWNAAGEVVISSASTGNTLRISNNGTGNSLVVEDSANPDSSPFVIDAAGNVGIGAASPASKLHIEIPTGNNDGIRINHDATTGDVRRNIYFTNTSGTNVLGEVSYYSGTYGPKLGFRTFEAGAAITFGTDTGTERMRIDSNGIVNVGNATPGINRLYGSSGNPLYGLVDSAITLSTNIDTVNHRVGIAFSPAGRTGSGIFSNNITAAGGNEDSNLEFYTSKEGNVNAALGMTLDQNGVLAIGTTSTYGSAKLAVAGGMQVLVPNGGGQSNIQTYILGIGPSSTKTFTWTPSDSVYQLTDIHVSSYVSSGAGFCHARWSIGGYLTSGSYSDIYEMRRINGGAVTCSVASLYNGVAVRFTITNTSPNGGGIQVRIMEATQGNVPGTLVVT